MYFILIKKFVLVIPCIIVEIVCFLTEDLTWVSVVAHFLTLYL